MNKLSVNSAFTSDKINSVLSDLVNFYIITKFKKLTN